VTDYHLTDFAIRSSLMQIAVKAKKPRNQAIYGRFWAGRTYSRRINDDRMMITCCNDGTRPVIFKIERIDIPENDEEREWLAKQDFRNTAEDAYTG
jgi:hypothetical protein